MMPSTTASHERSREEWIDLDLAALSLEEGGSPAEAEASARQAIEVFHNGRATNDEAEAIALLARSLFAEGKSDQALKANEQALAVSEKAEPNIRLSVAVTVARMPGASLHNGSLTPVLDALIGTLAKARKLGYFGIELEARLALGEIEVKSGVRTRGRAQLQICPLSAQSGFTPPRGCRTGGHGPERRFPPEPGRRKLQLWLTCQASIAHEVNQPLCLYLLTLKLASASLP
jgi:tetratricopeptide (TPR) repeat protein